MGGTYYLDEFKDRQSQYPTRRKLIHNPEDESNVYTVQRDEGTVTEEGIAFSADFMNAFDSKIGDMFPVSIQNGGTGATTLEGALEHLGLAIVSGTWTPQLSAVEGLPPTYTQEYCTARYMLRDPECFISFRGKWNITNSGSGYACITGLPYNAGIYDGQALALRELSGAIIRDPTRCGTVVDGTNRIDFYGENGMTRCQWSTGSVWVGFTGIYLIR